MAPAPIIAADNSFSFAFLGQSEKVTNMDVDDATSLFGDLEEDENQDQSTTMPPTNSLPLLNSFSFNVGSSDQAGNNAYVAHGPMASTQIAGAVARGVEQTTVDEAKNAFEPSWASTVAKQREYEVDEYKRELIASMLSKKMPQTQQEQQFAGVSGDQSEPEADGDFGQNGGPSDLTNSENGPSEDANGQDADGSYEDPFANAAYEQEEQEQQPLPFHDVPSEDFVDSDQAPMTWSWYEGQEHYSFQSNMCNNTFPTANEMHEPQQGTAQVWPQDPRMQSAHVQNHTTPPSFTPTQGANMNGTWRHTEYLGQQQPIQAEPRPAPESVSWPHTKQLYDTIKRDEQRRRLYLHQQMLYATTGELPRNHALVIKPPQMFPAGEMGLQSADLSETFLVFLGPDEGLDGFPQTATQAKLRIPSRLKREPGKYYSEDAGYQFFKVQALRGDALRKVLSTEVWPGRPAGNWAFDLQSRTLEAYLVRLTVIPVKVKEMWHIREKGLPLLPEPRWVFGTELPRGVGQTRQ
ncbi:hypothetical protein C8F01DRAFT_1242356 [Mycena amicta]|nr:hypothetical protein C8F01DRAFT_1242356 [Mycena amicta]